MRALLAAILVLQVLILAQGAAAPLLAVATSAELRGRADKMAKAAGTMGHAANQLKEGCARPVRLHRLPYGKPA